MHTAIAVADKSAATARERFRPSTRKIITRTITDRIRSLPNALTCIASAKDLELAAAIEVAGRVR
jgi:chromosomal replication initiation ATPase DnaA